MLKKLIAVSFLALIFTFNTTVEAQTALAPRNAFLESLQSSVTKVIGAQYNSVQITLTGSVLTVLRVNSNQNDSNHAGRNNEATAIAGVASKALATDATNAIVDTIRVQYVNRDGAHPDGEVVDLVEFRKNSKGDFEIHTSQVLAAA